MNYAVKSISLKTAVRLPIAEPLCGYSDFQPNNHHHATAKLILHIFFSVPLMMTLSQ